MKITVSKVLLLLVGLISAREYYNILSVDGGGIRGIIPAMVLEQMELYAFKYAKEKNKNVPQYPGNEGKVALKDLFDMFAGTSTGSILAAGFSYPNDEEGKDKTKPKFFATDILKIYSERGEDIFVPNNAKPMIIVFWVFFFVAILGGIGYLVGLQLYDSPEIRKSLKNIRTELFKKEEKRLKQSITKSLLKFTNKNKNHIQPIHESPETSETNNLAKIINEGGSQDEISIQDNKFMKNT